MGALTDKTKPATESVGCESAVDTWAAKLADWRGVILDAQGHSIMATIAGKKTVIGCTAKVDIRNSDGTITRTEAEVDTLERTATVSQGRMRPQAKGDPKLISSIGMGLNVTDTGAIGTEVSEVTIKANANDRKGQVTSYSRLDEGQQAHLDDLQAGFSDYAKQAGLGVAPDPVKKPTLKIGATP